MSSRAATERMTLLWYWPLEAANGICMHVAGIVTCLFNVMSLYNAK